MRARHERWPIEVIIEREPELRWVPNDQRGGYHTELEDGGEYRIDLGGALFEHMAYHANYQVGERKGHSMREFHVAARVENGELVLSLAYRAVEQPDPLPEPLPESELLACPGCGGFVRRYVLTGELPCPLCGWTLGERA